MRKLHGKLNASRFCIQNRDETKQNLRPTKKQLRLLRLRSGELAKYLWILIETYAGRRWSQWPFHTQNCFILCTLSLRNEIYLNYKFRMDQAFKIFESETNN